MSCNDIQPRGSTDLKGIEWRSDIFHIHKENIMSIDRMVMAFAGAMILLSIVLTLAHSAYWLFLTGFVGANLFQASFTGFCPLAIILKKVGFKPGVAFE
jgi:hypothetical protein